ncbi:MAG: substrate-binding domain-containing protein [Eubacteriales bacterium]
MKIIKVAALIATVAATIITSACSGGQTFDKTSEINVISREDGSGTRGAFIELFGVEEKDADGNKTDKTTLEATIVNNTATVMTTVSGDVNAIGYISLGSLNDTVKALKIDGVVASAENVKNGTYKVSRPFNIATKGAPNAQTADFIAFILSDDGQKVISDNHYISVDSTGAYTSSDVSGKIVVAGSSSVTPVMEKLKEAYVALNPKAEIEVQQSDSSTGMSSAISGSCDIGMASRELKDSEKAELTPTVIAIDGLAIIVHKDNTTEDLTSAKVKEIYTGAVTTWDKTAA